MTAWRFKAAAWWKKMCNISLIELYQPDKRRIPSDGAYQCSFFSSSNSISSRLVLSVSQSVLAINGFAIRLIFQPNTFPVFFSLRHALILRLILLRTTAFPTLLLIVIPTEKNGSVSYRHRTKKYCEWITLSDCWKDRYSLRLQI